MSNVKPLALLSVPALALSLALAYPQTADAQAACCRVDSDGTLIAAESSPRCNASAAETRKISSGNYEVDFLVPDDVRPMVKLLTLDTQTTGSTAWMAGVSDRSGDVSSVFIKIRNHENAAVDSGFNLCLF